MDAKVNIDHFFEISRELMCIAGTDGVLRRINPAFEKNFGYTNEELTGKSLLDFIHPEDLTVAKRKIQDFHSSKTSDLPFSHRFKDKKGLYRWLDWNVIDISEGCIFAIARDVTVAREKSDLMLHLEKNLERPSELLDIVLNAIPDFVCLINEQFQFIFVNKSAAASMGLAQERFAGRTLEELDIHYRDIDKYQEEISSVFKTGDPISSMLSLMVKEKQVDMEYSIMPIFSNGTVSGVIYSARDITDKIKDRKNFEASEKKLKKIIDLVPYPIFLKDKGYKYSLINTAQADLFHTTYEYLIGKTDGEFFVDPEELNDVVNSDRKIIEEQVSIVLPEQIITDFEGNKVVLHTTKIPFFNEIDNSVNILGISIDITAVKKSEEELLRTNFELDSFVYKSSHDLRAPLRSLMGLINLAKKEHDPDMRNHILDRSHKSIVKLDTFILELTNFSRNSRVELVVKKIDFEGIIKECVENLKFMENAQNVQIITEIDEKTEFFSDPGRITILFMNLISNAIKYQNSEAAEPFVKIAISSDHRQSQIIISDNGIGIETEFHRKIFDMFFRASENSFGSGLGLYIVKQVVDKLTGTITLNSVPEKGSEFTIVLPSMSNRLGGFNKLG